MLRRRYARWTKLGLEVKDLVTAALILTRPRVDWQVWYDSSYRQHQALWIGPVRDVVGLTFSEIAEMTEMTEKTCRHRYELWLKLPDLIRVKWMLQLMHDASNRLIDRDSQLTHARTAVMHHEWLYFWLPPQTTWWTADTFFRMYTDPRHMEPFASMLGRPVDDDDRATDT